MKTLDIILKNFIQEILDKLRAKPDLYFFLKWFVIFLLLFLVIVSMSLLNIISTESNPFFYEQF